MRLILALPLLMLAACSVQKDANGQTTVEINSQPVEDAASNLGNAAEGAASDVANATSSAGQAIENDVGNVHGDVDVGRRRPDNQH